MRRICVLCKMCNGIRYGAIKKILKANTSHTTHIRMESISFFFSYYFGFIRLKKRGDPLTLTYHKTPYFITLANWINATFFVNTLLLLLLLLNVLRIFFSLNAHCKKTNKRLFALESLRNHIIYDFTAAAFSLTLASILDMHENYDRYHPPSFRLLSHQWAIYLQSLVAIIERLILCAFLGYRIHEEKWLSVALRPTGGSTLPYCI